MDGTGFRGVFHVRLMHSGKVVNIWSRFGANEFLKQCETKDDFEFFSLELKKADAIRKRGKRKGKLNASDRQSLRDIYEKLAAVAHCGDVALFRERVPERETTAWLEHTTAVFQEVSKDPYWIKSGNLLRHDEQLLSCCRSLLDHPAPVIKVLQDNTFYESISALVLANKEAFLNNQLYALFIVRIVGEPFRCCLHVKRINDPVDVKRMDDPWPPEKIFKKLEASGILERFLLCAAVKLDGGKNGGTTKNLILDKLVRCVAFIKRRFKAGTPCGDCLRAILDGRMTVCPLSLPYLQSILKLSNIFEDAEAKPTSHSVDFCQYCGKTSDQYTFLQCARCRLACYCSKECQRAHWKKHKLNCHESNRPSENQEAMGTVLSRVVEDKFMHIMKRLVEESEKAGGLRMEDMMIEVDFRPDSIGNVSMLQEPPHFKVFSSYSNFLEKEEDSDVKFSHSEEELRMFADSLNNYPPPDGLCCSTIFPDGTKRICIFSKLKKVLFSEEILEACRSLFLEGNHDSLNALLKAHAGSSDDSAPHN